MILHWFLTPPVTRVRLTMTALGRPWSGEQMELSGRPKSRPWAGPSEVGDSGTLSSCGLEPFQKGQLIRDRFLLKVFCWAGSARRKNRKSEKFVLPLVKKYNKAVDSNLMQFCERLLEPKKPENCQMFCLFYHKMMSNIPLIIYSMWI